jgi:small-conductance mechanosensitive channel
MSPTSVVTSTLSEFVDGVVASLPTLLSGLLFLVLAFLFVRAVRYGLRSVLDRAYPPDQSLIADFFVIVVTVFLWFAVALVFLKVIGMGDIASSLGTAAGFIALGVSYALSNMVEDTVAGVYLLRDPDFNPGDTVTASGTTGTVLDIGLRKSRLELDDGDTVVMANRDVESRWTRRSDDSQDA